MNGAFVRQSPFAARCRHDSSESAQLVATGLHGAAWHLVDSLSAGQAWRLFSCVFVTTRRLVFAPSPQSRGWIRCAEWGLGRVWQMACGVACCILCGVCCMVDGGRCTVFGVNVAWCVL